MRLGLSGLVVLALAALPARAQDMCPCPTPTPKPPEPNWKGSVGLGLALNGGNSDTKSYNLSFAAAYDPKRKNVFKTDGLYLRSDTDGVATVDKTAAGVRDEYKVSARAFVFGEVRYLRDAFKNIDYLVSPLAGAGWNLADSDKAKFALDVAAGGQFERDKNQASTSSGAAQAGERLNLKLSNTASLLHRATALWKLDDFGDALYRFEVSVQASISKRTELRFSFNDDYKTRPPNKSLKKNDTSLVAALIIKIG